MRNNKRTRTIQYPNQPGASFHDNKWDDAPSIFNKNMLETPLNHSELAGDLSESTVYKTRLKAM
ncbi:MULTISPECIES: hypothetical protein [Brevibacillus]|uniref:hypothetical protein n=1 Tax=Brevibacillus TaxID=55080 RepID=UPI00287F88AD|nr:hypothetical protein [Brevibacillus borstelensis]WNF05522.1 hypothetical protein RFB14_24870 [Brevibacillus borstelensis]